MTSNKKYNYENINKKYNYENINKKYKHENIRHILASQSQPIHRQNNNLQKQSPPP